MDAFIQYESGVYILTGTLNEQQLVKVGKTISGLDRRLSQLNYEQYAGVSDWKLHCWFDLSNARLVSAVEKIAHDELHRHQILLPNGSGGTSTEVFDICPDEATMILRDAVNDTHGAFALRATLISDGQSDLEVSSQKIPRSLLKRMISTVTLMTILALGLIGLSNIPALS